MASDIHKLVEVSRYLGSNVGNVQGGRRKYVDQD